MALSVRLVRLDQPLLEGFIDRQVHTAMMARNIARGGSVFYPQIDIGPFPAYYMLEFPGFPALAAGLAAVTGAELDLAGRLVSAIAMAVACVILFALVRRYDGPVVAFVAAAMLALMPVTVRYGRSFQADATMFALLVAGVWSMDRWAEQGRGRYLLLAALTTSGALLLKVIAAYVLVPLAYLTWKRCGRAALGRWELWAALAVVALPPLAWYVHAWSVASGTTTVSTPFWQVHKWIALERLVELSTYRQMAYFIGLRVLTPIGVCLAVVGALLRVRDPSPPAPLPQGERGEVSRGGTRQTPLPLGERGRGEGSANVAGQPLSKGGMLFHVWAASLATYLPILVRRLDHEHYYLALAPVAAVFMARALCALATAPLASRFYVSGKAAAVALGAGLIVTDALACASTFRTPSEWRSVTAAAAAAREFTPPDALVAGHSSVLFYADRRGFTFAYRPHEVQYLFSTWGRLTSESTPTALLEFYRERGADYFVELLGTGREQNNTEFFEYVRARYRGVREEPGEYLVVALRVEGLRR